MNSPLIPQPVRRYNDALARFEIARLELHAAERHLRDYRERVYRPEGRPIALCGTDSGYYRHVRTLGQPACDACKQAHSDAERERSRKRRVA